MRVEGTDDFYDVLFHSWTNDSEYEWDGQNGGGFSYTRTRVDENGLELFRLAENETGILNVLL